MPYPGAAFALALGVAIGAAVYYYFFNDEKPQQHKQNSYARPSPPSSARNKKEIPCTICLDEMTAVTRLRALSCGHVFHYGCVTKWINQHKSCPNCRTYQSI